MSNIGNIRNFTHKELRNMEQDTLVVDAELGAQNSIFSMKWKCPPIHHIIIVFYVNIFK